MDEFAQLKTRFPQFMSQLQEIARIGRSLGIHLVLSTQKPSGIAWISTSLQVSNDNRWESLMIKLCQIQVGRRAFM